jgi:hypothetical protein
VASFSSQFSRKLDALVAVLKKASAGKNVGLFAIVRRNDEANTAQRVSDRASCFMHITSWKKQMRAMLCCIVKNVTRMADLNRI